MDTGAYLGVPALQLKSIQLLSCFEDTGITLTFPK